MNIVYVRIDTVKKFSYIQNFMFSNKKSKIPSKLKILWNMPCMVAVVLLSLHSNNNIQGHLEFSVSIYLYACTVRNRHAHCCAALRVDLRPKV